MPLPLPVAPPGPPGSLAQALATVPEPRRPNGWRPDRPPLPLVGILQLAGAAMLGGCRSLDAVAQWGRDRIAEEPAALVVLGLPAGRSPSHPTLHRVFAALDAPAFERALGAWVTASGVDPADALAVDGKTLRGIQGDAVPGVYLVAAYAHRAGCGAGPGSQSGQGTGTRGGAGRPRGGPAGGAAGDGGCAPDPARHLPPDRGGRWRLSPPH